MKLISFLLVLLNPVAHAQDNTADDQKKTYVKLLHDFQYCGFKYSSKSISTSYDGATKLINEETGDVLRQLNEWRITSKRKAEWQPSKGKKSQDVFSEEILTERSFLVYLSRDPSGKNCSVFGKLKSVDPTDKRGCYERDFSILIMGLFGFNGGVGIEQILEESSVGIENKNLSNVGYKEIHAKSKWGEVTIVMKAADGSLSRIEIFKGSDAWIGDKKISDLPMMEASVWSPKAKLSYYNATADFSDHVMVNGVLVPRRLKANLTEGYDGNKSFTRTIDLSFSDWKFYSPNQPNMPPIKLTRHIPNGTQVTARDDEVFEYEWQNGEVVKKISQVALDRLEKLKYENNKKWMIITIPVACFLILALGVLYYVRKRRRSFIGTYR